MSFMFFGATSFQQNLSSWNISGGTSIRGMLDREHFD